MNKFIGMLFVALLVSTQALSAEVKELLLEDEIQLAIKLSDKYHVPVQVDGICAKTEFEVVSRVRGFNPATWTLVSSAGENFLSYAELQEIIVLFDRVEVPLTHIDPITTETRATISGTVCGFNPKIWTISFEEE